MEAYKGRTKHAGPKVGEMTICARWALG